MPWLWECCTLKGSHFGSFIWPSPLRASFLLCYLHSISKLQVSCWGKSQPGNVGWDLYKQNNPSATSLKTDLQQKNPVWCRMYNRSWDGRVLYIQSELMQRPVSLKSMQLIAIDCVVNPCQTFTGNLWLSLHNLQHLVERRRKTSRHSYCKMIAKLIWYLYVQYISKMALKR